MSDAATGRMSDIWTHRDAAIIRRWFSGGGRRWRSSGAAKGLVIGVVAGIALFLLCKIPLASKIVPAIFAPFQREPYLVFNFLLLYLIKPMLCAFATAFPFWFYRRRSTQSVLRELWLSGLGPKWVARAALWGGLRRCLGAGLGMYYGVALVFFAVGWTTLRQYSAIFDSYYVSVLYVKPWWGVIVLPAADTAVSFLLAAWIGALTGFRFYGVPIALAVNLLGPPALSWWGFQWAFETKRFEGQILSTLGSRINQPLPLFIYMAYGRTALGWATWIGAGVLGSKAALAAVCHGVVWFRVLFGRWMEKKALAGE